MCCFSRPVAHVSTTRVYARPLGDGRQALAYAMRFAADEDLAMVLPLPVPPGAAEDAVRFVDLSAAPRLFDALDAAWPPVAQTSRHAPAPAAPKLVVHAVGAFEASFVPTVADFARLDPRFRLDPAVWAALGEEQGGGFAVFKLRSTRAGGLGRWFGRAEATDAHPMAFVFPTRDPGRVYFPTVHVHDGRVAATAAFDHTLYLQAPGRPRTFGGAFPVAWRPSSERLPAVPGSADLLDPADIGWRAVVQGELPNRDVWVSLGARPTAALVERVARALHGPDAPAALAALAALPALPGEDPHDVALAALRPLPGEPPGLPALLSRVRAFPREHYYLARNPAVVAWRRTGARYTVEEGTRHATADEAAWEAWLATVGGG